MKYAICVGINVYKNFPEDTLQGCLRDAENMNLFLHQNLDIKLEGFRVLLDQQATKAAILAAWQEIAARLKPGDYFAYTMSGHGTFSQDGAGVVNFFCCHDIAAQGDDWDPQTGFSATEFHKMAAELPCRAEFWLDTCHAAGGLRELGRTYGKAKFLPHPLLNDQVGRPSLAAEISRGDDGGPAPVSAPPYLTPANAVLWAACGKHQTAADGGPAGGIFTQSFLKAYQAGESRHNGIIAIKEEVRRLGYLHQEPLLQCTAALALQAVGH